MTRRKLPIGVQTFRTVREDHCYYVDKTVVLLDEYDKPILDALDAPEVARANRGFLRGLYAVIKDRDAHIRFSFITGVSRSLQRGSARGYPSHETASKDHRAPRAAGRRDVLPAGVSEPGGAAEPEPEPAQPDDGGRVPEGRAQRAARPPEPRWRS